MSHHLVLRYDVAILGGGPAGTATALSLLKHNPSLSIVIVERSGYDRPRIGETLPPNTRPLLEQLGVWTAFTEAGHLPAYGTSAAWGSDALHANESFFHLHGHGWHLNRCAFDKMLAEAAVQRSATLHQNSRVLDARQQDDGWQLTIQTQDDVPRLLSARFVVDATGRLAWFARHQGARRIVYDQLTGIAVLFDAGSESIDTYSLLETCELGWWYSALIPNKQLIVMQMSDADLIRQHRLKDPAVWLCQLRETHHTQARLGHARPLGRPSTYAAHTQRLEPMIGENWLAVGDAASTFDPLSSQGIHKALTSGLLASYAILDWFKGRLAGLERYAALHAREFEQYRATWADYYAREQRWPAADFWQRRKSRMYNHVTMT